MDPFNLGTEPRDEIVKSKWSKALLIAGIVATLLIALVLSYGGLTHGKLWESVAPSKKVVASESKDCTATTEIIDRPDLKLGDVGDCVIVLQDLLNKLDYKFYREAPVGSFAGNTAKNVGTFQQDYDLKVDKNVGPDTWKMLENPKKKTTLSPSPTEKASEMPSSTSSATPTPSPSPSSVSPSPSTMPTSSPTPTSVPAPKPTTEPIKPSPKPKPTVKPKPSPKPTKAPVTGSYNRYTGPNTTNSVVLSFDDCPKSLASFKATVTAAEQQGIALVLAPTGNCIDRGLFIADFARQHGHFVINHSVSHHELNKMTFKQIENELGSPGVKSSFVRPPYGAGAFDPINQNLQKAIDKMHMQFWLWDVDTEDWKGNKPERQIIDYVLTHSKPGSTVLMHMNHNAFNSGALDKMKAGLKKRGMTVCHNGGKPTSTYPKAADFCR